MNFLAHCLLASPGEGWIAGGVLGDFVKGPIPEDLPPALRAGIWLHRRIDTFSNALPPLRHGFARFHPRLRRPAPVLLDIVADHCLALGWRRYCEEELPAFAAKAYAACHRHDAWAPARARRFVDHMATRDLLAAYRDADVIRRAMHHVLQRLRMAHLAPLADAALDRDLPGFVDDFERYFPALADFARSERQRAPFPLAKRGRRRVSGYSTILM